MTTATLESGERIRFARRVYWSVAAGCQVERISLPDAHGQEHWVELERPVGREERRAALEKLARHAKQNCDPGRVELEGDWI